MQTVNPIANKWRKDATADPIAFWERAAADLPWFRKWDEVFRWDFPEFRWFSGARTNIAYNAIDRHVKRGWGGHAALAYANERGERQVFTYSQLKHEVERIAAALRGMGIRKGDRVTIYMPVSPEAIALMLACVRIGAIHSVVFAGFGAGALGDRIQASGSRLVFTTDITYRKGRDIPLKGIVDASLEIGGDQVESVIVVKRAADTPMTPGRDITWQDFLSRGEGNDGGYVEMEANEPAYILATSGTTAKPKLAVHTHGGYQVGIHSLGKWCFGLRDTDVWWATSDIGWVVGHSYIVYAPLLAGSTTIAFEGAIDHPQPDAIWRICEEFGITGMFTSPTAVRLLMRYGDEGKPKTGLAALERIVCAGEVLNPPAWEWLQQEVLRDRIPVIDHYWQTRNGRPPLWATPTAWRCCPSSPDPAARRCPA